MGGQRRQERQRAGRRSQCGGCCIDFCIVLVGGQSARSASGREGVLSVEAAVLISALFWFSIDFWIVLVGGQSARSVSGREGVLSVEAAVLISALF